MTPPLLVGLMAGAVIVAAPRGDALRSRDLPVVDVAVESRAEQAAPGDREDAFRTRFGAWAFVLAPLLMVVVAILPIPAEFPALLNGMMFGAVVGTAITYSGAMVGAVVSFELARRFGRPLAERMMKPAVLVRADRLVESTGWPGLLTLRLIPAVAFTAINWVAGLTAVGRWTFVWTTAVGILPGAIVFTASGTGLAALVRAYPAAAWGIGLAVVLVTWWTVVRYRQGMPVEGAS